MFGDCFASARVLSVTEQLATRFPQFYLTQPTPDMDPAELRTELNWLLA